MRAGNVAAAVEVVIQYFPLAMYIGALNIYVLYDKRRPYILANIYQIETLSTLPFSLIAFVYLFIVNAIWDSDFSETKKPVAAKKRSGFYFA